MNLKQIKFDEDDLKAVEAVRQLYGCDSFSQAVRLAARIVASGQRLAFPLPSSSKYSKAKREFGSVEGLIQLPEDMDPNRLDAALAEAATSHRFTWHDPKPTLSRPHRTGASRIAPARSSP